jgi:anaphase-promoting complex subunit 2
MTDNELDRYWAEIAQVLPNAISKPGKYDLQVFKLPPELGCPPVPPGSERASLLTEACLAFLQTDPELAMFVEDFVLDAYNIQLREEVRLCAECPGLTIIPGSSRLLALLLPRGAGGRRRRQGGARWLRAVLQGGQCRAQSRAVQCSPRLQVSHLHASAMAFSPGLEELSRLRQRAGTARPLYGQPEVAGLWRLYLAGSLHAQLPADWQPLVRQFYARAFAVFYNRVEASGGEAGGGQDDSTDWTGELLCRGCDQQTDSCVCHAVTTSFQAAMEKLGQLGLLERLSGQVVLETVEERIQEQVQTSRGSFDCSYLGPLEGWLDRTVVAWLRSVPSIQPAEVAAVRTQLIGCLYETYTKTRIEQLFEIIIEFPESQPALEDLRDCLGQTEGLRATLTSSLRQVLDAKLLHPGVNTADILTAYIAAIRALRVLDGSGVVLELVCSNVRRYLKTREDTVRCIVQSLIDEATELTEELTKGAGLQLDHSFQDDGAVLEDWQAWQPDPVDAPAGGGQHGRRSADIISMLVNIYGSKELFVNEYRSLLSNRLLAQRSYDTDKEIRYLELLKLRFGDVPLHQCEVMLKDIGDSKRINSHLHSGEGEGGQELLHQVFPVNALILSAQFWPQFKAENLELPQEVADSLDVYTKAFQNSKGNRTLVWKPHLGFANIDLEIGDKKINLTVSPIHAAIIHRFQEQAVWGGQQLAASLRLPLSTLRRRISFWQDQGFLRESTSAPDSWSLVEEGPRAGQGRADMSLHGEGCSGQQDEDSVTASSADQREEELGMFWSYITGMLTNLESLPLERIHQMLRIFAMQPGPSAAECDLQELRAFLDTKVRQHKLAFSGGHYRLPK